WRYRDSCTGEYYERSILLCFKEAVREIDVINAHAVVFRRGSQNANPEGLSVQWVTLPREPNRHLQLASLSSSFQCLGCGTRFPFRMCEAYTTDTWSALMIAPRVTPLSLG